MNTTENNRLIAEFLNKKYKDDYIVIGYWNKCKVNPSGEVWEKTKYHSDWNSLMEVIEKIESLHETNNVLIGTNITYVQIHNKLINEQKIFKGVSNIKIQAVYKACVEFIKWYNEQKIEL